MCLPARSASNSLRGHRWSLADPHVLLAPLATLLSLTCRFAGSVASSSFGETNVLVLGGAFGTVPATVACYVGAKQYVVEHQCKHCFRIAKNGTEVPKRLAKHRSVQHVWSRLRWTD